MSKVIPPFIEDTDLHSHIVETLQQLNSEITPDNPIAPYLEAYNNMFTKFDESYERNLQLVRLCREMNSAVILNANKISDILKYIKETSETIESLRAEYEKARLRLKTSSESAEEKQNEFNQLKDKYNEIKQAIQPSEEYYRQIKESEQDMANIKEQIESTNQLLDNIKSENEWFQNEILKIEAEAKEYEKQKIIARKEKEDVNKDILEMENSIKLLSDNKNSNEIPIEEAQKRIKEIKDQTFDLDLQIASIKAETNTIKARTAKLPKEIREQKKHLQVNLEQKEFLENQISKKTAKHVELVDELNSITEETDSNVIEYKRLIDQHRQNQMEKSELLARHTQLRDQLNFLQFSVTKRSNDNRTDNRLLILDKVVLSNQRKETQDEQRATRDADEMTKNVISETSQKKQSISEMHEKVTSIESDIYSRTIEKSDYEQKTANLEEKTRRNNEENDNQLRAHNRIKQRIDEQSELIKNLAQEKSVFKRQFENVSAEYSELKDQYEMLAGSIEAMTEKVDKIVEETKASKTLKEEANIASEALEKMRETAIEGIERSKSSTQKLQAEQRTLTCVIEGTERRQAQQENEYRVMVSNYVMLQNQYELKNRQKDQLSSEKESIEAFRHKSEVMFNEKMDEIFTLKDELNVHQERNKDLQTKVKRYNELIREKSRCIDMLAIEKKKKMCLYRLSVGSYHISPYSLILSSSLEENEDSLNRAYLIDLNQRIVDAIQELDKLKKERDELEQELKSKKEKLSSDFTVEEAKKFIEAYNRDIKEKDIEIEKCREMIRANKEKTSSSKEKNIQTRLAVSHRKSLTQQLRQTNVELRKNIRTRNSDDQLFGQQISSLDLSFITEPSAYMYQESSARIRKPRFNDNTEQNARLDGNFNQNWPPPLLHSPRYQQSLNPKIRIPKAERSPRYNRKYAMKT